MSAEVPFCVVLTPCQGELNSFHGPQSTTAQPGFRGGTHGYVFSTCSSLKRQLALKRDSLIVEYAFCFTLKTPELILTIPLFSKQLSHGKAGKAEEQLAPPDRHCPPSPGNRHSPKATRAPGAFGQCSQRQGEILGCPAQGQGLGWMILVSPFLNEYIL